MPLGQRRAATPPAAPRPGAHARPGCPQPWAWGPGRSRSTPPDRSATAARSRGSKRWAPGLHWPPRAPAAPSGTAAAPSLQRPGGPARPGRSRRLGRCRGWARRPGPKRTLPCPAAVTAAAQSPAAPGWPPGSRPRRRSRARPPALRAPGGAWTQLQASFRSGQASTRHLLHLNMPHGIHVTPLHSIQAAHCRVRLSV